MFLWAKAVAAIPFWKTSAFRDEIVRKQVQGLQLSLNLQNEIVGWKRPSKERDEHKTKDYE
jgi:hypothetical protein